MRQGLQRVANRPGGRFDGRFLDGMQSNLPACPVNGKHHIVQLFLTRVQHACGFIDDDLDASKRQIAFIDLRSKSLSLMLTKALQAKHHGHSGLDVPPGLQISEPIPTLSVVACRSILKGCNAMGEKPVFGLRHAPSKGLLTQGWYSPGEEIAQTPEHARGMAAIQVSIDDPFGGIIGLSVDADELQGAAVQDMGMAGTVGEFHGVIGCGCIQVPSIGVAILGKIGFIVPARTNPFAPTNLESLLVYPVSYVGNGSNACVRFEGDDDEALGQSTEVQMCIDETRKYGSPPKVDDLGAAALQILYLIPVSYKQNLPVLNGKTTTAGFLGIHGQNVRIDQYQICHTINPAARWPLNPSFR
jgi:hypothetical protein